MTYPPRSHKRDMFARLVRIQLSHSIVTLFVLWYIGQVCQTALAALAVVYARCLKVMEGLLSDSFDSFHRHVVLRHQGLSLESLYSSASGTHESPSLHPISAVQHNVQLSRGSASNASRFPEVSLNACGRYRIYWPSHTNHNTKIGFEPNHPQTNQNPTKKHWK